MTYRLTLLDGKYTVEHTNGTDFKAYRNGGSEVWRDLTGDGLMLAFVQRIEELEEELLIAFDRGLNEGYAIGTGRSEDYDE